MAKGTKHLLPKEHGAWGLLTGSFFSVVAITGKLNGSMLLFLLAVVLFYFSRHIFLHLLHAKLSFSAWLPFFTFAAAGWLLLCAAARLADYWLILPLSLVMALFLLAEIILIRAKKQRSFLAQSIGTVGLTSVAPFTFILFYGEITRFAAFLWLINILFFGSGILYVRYQIARMKQNYINNTEFHHFRAGVICYHFLLLVILLFVALSYNNYAGLLIAFAPAVLQAATAVNSRFKIKTVKKLGWLEMVHTLLFIALLALFF